jgi:hypothetical protein
MRGKFSVLCGTVFLLASIFVVLGTAQVVPPQQANAAGTWDVTIHGRSTVDGKPLPTRTEQWVIQQNGEKLTGTAKVAGGDMALVATLKGQVLRGSLTAGDKQNGLFLTISGDDVYGTVAENAIRCNEHGSCEVTGEHGSGKVSLLLGKRAK